MMSEWEEYTGSDEQIAEIEKAVDVLVRFIKTENEKLRSNYFSTDFYEWLHTGQITHYLICNPHPLADMICQQAMTGQPVWVRYKLEWDRRSDTIETDCTTTPDWNIPGAEYSFTPFEEEVCKEEKR